MKPFTITIPDADITDLRKRLSESRWTDDLNTSPWRLGPDVAYMKELAEYWQHSYDWRAHEATLNQYPQFLMDIDNVTLHFMHVRSTNSKAMPLLLLHGWPDSFYRFHKLIPLLDEFHLVIPSLPGFGFSQAMPKTPIETGSLLAQLMAQLGYEKYLIHGGDVGGIVARSMARHHSELLHGIHMTDAGYPTGKEADLSLAEQKFLQDTTAWGHKEGAYLKIQATKPQTIGFALDNSPVALLAWIAGMVHSQAKEHDIEAAFGGKDEFITNAMMYWLTQTSGSAAAFYERIVTEAHTITETVLTKVPVGISLFPRELQFPKEWAERSMNVVSFETMSCGGHFAALEEPQILASSIKEFVKKLPL